MEGAGCWGAYGWPCCPGKDWACPPGWPGSGCRGRPSGAGHGDSLRTGGTEAGGKDLQSAARDPGRHLDSRNRRNRPPHEPAGADGYDPCGYTGPCAGRLPGPGGSGKLRAPLPGRDLRCAGIGPGDDRFCTKELEAALAKPPYFYSMPQILKFQDNNGRVLYGQYTEDDLKEFLQKMTTDGEANELPQLLVFKVESGTRYYVYKKKVSQVIVRLCNEAHDAIEKQLEDHWYDVMMDYERLPEMSNASEFEACLHELVEKHSPILYALQRPAHA